jgi:hypothetical protein
MGSEKQNYDPLLDSYYGRNEEFFQTGAVRNSGTLSLRKEFNSSRDVNVYYLKKDSNSDVYPTSFLHFIGNEIFQVADILRGLLAEIAATPYQDDIPSLQRCEHNDPKDPQFWSKGQVASTDGDNILIRPIRVSNGQYSIKFLLPIVGNMFMGRTCSLFATQASQLVKLIEAFEKDEQDEKKAERMKKLEKIVGVKLLEQQVDACSSSAVEKDTAMIKPQLTARKRQRIYSTDDEADRDEPPPPGSDVVEGR